MSTVEKVELENGVVLGEALEYEGTYKLTKDEARTVFEGTVNRIFCRCAVPTCEIPSCGDRFDVEYVHSAAGRRIYIGCVHFNHEQVAQVKKWLGE